MKKFLALSFLALGLLIGAGRSEAASPSRGAKQLFPINYTVTASSPTARAGPITVYSVIMSTGAGGDYVALFDTNTVTGVTATLLTTMTTRCMAASTIATTMCNYDPPLQFRLGLGAILSSALNQALIVYEPGRVTQGY